MLFPQILLETHAVITDGRRVTRPLAARRAWQEMATLAGTITLVYQGLEALDALAAVVQRTDPAAQEIFDAFFAAQMRAAGISLICTFDVEGLARYEGISVETPEATLSRFRLRS